MGGWGRAEVWVHHSDREASFFCSMFVTLCSSVCFRNVGCWHVPVLGPVPLSQGSIKKMIKKEYCRLSASPHSLQVTPSRAGPALVKGGQANWRPSLGLWGPTSLQVNKPPLHCGGVPLPRSPSLVASLHSEGPSHDCARRTRFWSRWLA